MRDIIKEVTKSLSIKQIINVDFNKMQPVKFLCKRLNLKTRTLNTIIASGNSGKTWLVDYLAILAANGFKFLDKHEIQKGNSLIIDQEQSEEQTIIRLKRIANGLNGDTKGVFRCEMSKFEEYKNNEFANIIKSTIKENDIKYIFIDSLRRITTADENGSEISIVLEVLKQITKEEDVSIIVIHHEGKTHNSDAKHVARGHSTIFDVSDCQINLSHNKKYGYRLKCGKVRDGHPFEDLCYNFRDAGEYISNIEKSNEIMFFEMENSLKLNEEDKITENIEITLEEQIINILTTSGKKLKTGEIKSIIGGAAQIIVDTLQKLLKENKIKTERKGNANLYWI